jgi:hypothetical protein
MLGTILGIASAALSIARSLTVIASAISVVAHTIISVCKALGLIENPNMKTEDLGEKALVAQEMEHLKPENFKTFEEYVKAIENFKVDPAQAEKYTLEEKMQKGLELTTGLLIDKYGESAAEVLREVAKRPDFFDDIRTLQYLEKASSVELNIGDISKLLDGKLKNVDAIIDAKEQMSNVEKIINPEITPRQLQQLIDKQKQE